MPYEFEDHEEQVVIESFFQAGDYIKVFVNTTYNVDTEYLDDTLDRLNNYPFIDGATITIETNNHVDTLEYIGNSSYQTTKIKAREQGLYKLTALVDGHAPVEAFTIVPNRPRITRFVEMANTEFAVSWGKGKIFKIELQRPVKNACYYYIRFENNQWIELKEPIGKTINESLGPPVFFSSGDFEPDTMNSNLDIYFGMDFYPGLKIKSFIVEIARVHADYYNYIKSLGPNSIFSEPVPIHSNIHNGTGVFTSYSVSRDTLYDLTW
jgi:hypothetical protein